MLVSSGTGDYPVFGRLETIYVVNSKKVFFEVQLLETVEFCEHFHCFLVQITHTPFVYVSSDSLLSPIPHHVRVLPGSIGTLCIVPLHHFVIDEV